MTVVPITPGTGMWKSALLALGTDRLSVATQLFRDPLHPTQKPPSRARLSVGHPRAHPTGPRTSLRGHLPGAIGPPPAALWVGHTPHTCLVRGQLESEGTEALCPDGGEALRELPQVCAPHGTGPRAHSRTHAHTHGRALPLAHTPAPAPARTGMLTHITELLGEGEGADQAECPPLAPGKDVGLLPGFRGAGPLLAAPRCTDKGRAMAHGPQRPPFLSQSPRPCGARPWRTVPCARRPCHHLGCQPRPETGTWKVRGELWPGWTLPLCPRPP